MKRPGVTRNEAAPVVLHAVNAAILAVSRRLRMDVDDVIELAIEELTIEVEELRARLGGGGPCVGTKSARNN